MTSDAGSSAADLLLAALLSGIDPGKLPELRAAVPAQGGDHTVPD